MTNLPKILIRIIKRKNKSKKYEILQLDNSFKLKNKLFFDNSTKIVLVRGIRD